VAQVAILMLDAYELHSDDVFVEYLADNDILLIPIEPSKSQLCGTCI
jgi:hypothetical protein